MQNQLLTIKEAAKYLGISEQALLLLRANCRGPPSIYYGWSHRKKSGTILYFQPDLLMWLQSTIYDRIYAQFPDSAQRKLQRCPWCKRHLAVAYQKLSWYQPSRRYCSERGIYQRAIPAYISNQIKGKGKHAAQLRFCSLHCLTEFQEEETWLRKRESRPVLLALRNRRLKKLFQGLTIALRSKVVHLQLLQEAFARITTWPK